MSRSNLAKLENNNYFPSFDKFILLLSRLNVTTQEFYVLSIEFKDNTSLNFSSDHYFQNTNKKMSENMVKVYLSNSETWYKFEMILFEQYIHLFTTTEIIFWTDFLIKKRKNNFYSNILVKILLSSSVHCLRNNKEKKAMLYSKNILDSFLYKDYLYEILVATIIVSYVENSTTSNYKIIHSFIKSLKIDLPQELESLISPLILEEDNKL